MPSKRQPLLPHSSPTPTNLEDRRKSPVTTISPLPPIASLTGSDLGDRYHSFIQATKSSLPPDQIKSTARYLQHESSLLHRISIQLSQRLVETYRQRLSEQRNKKSTPLPGSEWNNADDQHKLKWRSATQPDSAADRRFI
jgi:hypothetical protein